MDDTLLLEQLRESEKRNEALSCELALLRASQGRILNEFEALRLDYEALAAATCVITDDREALRQRVAELEVSNNRLVDMLWGRRSERRSESPDQQHLDFPDEPVEPPTAEQQEIITAQAKADEAIDLELLRRLEARRKARREKKKTRSEKFPPNIERRVRRIDLPEDQKQGLTYIGVDSTERLRYEKPHMFVEVIERPQYVVSGKPEEGVFSMPPPLAIIESCKYDFSVIATILSLKCAFHMPTYRQQDWFAQCGWFPRRSTTNDLINYGVATIVPLYQQMWFLLLEQPILLGDDTTLRVLLRDALSKEDLAKLGKRSRFRQAMDAGQPPNTRPPGSATSFAWLYTSLADLAPYNVFHWSLTHQNSEIDTHLATYRGIFVGDACGANARLEQRSEGRIIHSSCNTHARREFVEAESNDPILASQAISFYRQLYDVEERAKMLDAAMRYELRQRDSVPIWDRMRRWLDSDAIKRVLPKSSIGKAIGYLRNQWSALQVYLTDGRIPIDNNQSEQIIRPLTVGRNNWLFLGHPHAAPGRLQMYSVISSAHRHHLVVDDYLEDVLRKLADAQQNHPADLKPGSLYLLDLLPDRWAVAHPQSVRKERIEDKEMVFDAKRWRRAQERMQVRATQAAGNR
ncbi:MAG: IS66 family transposase [Actinomycetes bacterium]